MKKVFLMMLSVLLLTACLSSEERAARQAEALKMLKASIGSQKYRINITEMTPKRGVSNTVMGRWLKIEDNMVDCSLPYVGRDDIPHMKTRGEIRMDSKLEFRTEAQNYVLQYQPKKACGIITFKVDYQGSEYKFYINVDKSGSARIRVTPEDRDYIDYEGTVSPL